MKIVRYCVIVSICFVACKKPYAPPVINSTKNFLVVEGVINTTSDSTIIKLSRTVNLSTNNATSPELGAHVVVESDNNVGYMLTETGNGTYVASGFSLDFSHKYRLKITTSNSEQYLSSFEQPLQTPPIDSIGFMMQNNAQNTGIKIYVNTHDASNTVKYYYWNYSEAWQFHAKYESANITDGTNIIGRTPEQNIYSCFATDSSSTIVLGSSAGLMGNIIYQNPIIQIPSTSEKIETKYSIEVNQYALSGAAYSFWINLKKNTEQLGSIFDAEPSSLKGNIACISNPAEPVIGYITVSNIQHKRIYILNSQLPPEWQPAYPDNCELDSNWFSEPKTGNPPVNQVLDNLIPFSSSQIPVSAFYLSGAPGPAGYLSSTVECVDCTIRGTKKAPVFWK